MVNDSYFRFDDDNKIKYIDIYADNHKFTSLTALFLNDLLSANLDPGLS